MWQHLALTPFTLLVAEVVVVLRLLAVVVLQELWVAVQVDMPVKRRYWWPDVTLLLLAVPAAVAAAMLEHPRSQDLVSQPLLPTAARAAAPPFLQERNPAHQVALLLVVILMLLAVAVAQLPLQVVNKQLVAAELLE